MSVSYKYQLQELQKGIAELELRDMHPLRVYRPTPQQLPIHEASCSEVIVAGGKRCLAGWQKIYDPVLGISRPVSEIDDSFHVESLNPVTGEIEVRAASRPFIKGHGDLYRVEFSNGEVIFTTLGHRLVGSDKRWMSVRDLYAYGLPVASLCHSSAAKRTGPCLCGPIQQQFDVEVSSPAWHASHRESATDGSSVGCYCESLLQPDAVEKQQSCVCSRTREQSQSRSSCNTFPPASRATECLYGDGDQLQRPFEPILQESIAGSGQLVCGEGALCCSQITEDFQDRYWRDYRPCGAQPRRVAETCQEPFPLLACARARNLDDWPAGGGVGGLGHSHACQIACPPSRLHSLDAVECQTYDTVTTPPSESSRAGQQSAAVYGLPRDKADAAALELDHLLFALTHPCIKRVKNCTETIITKVEFVCYGPIYDIEVYGTANYLLGSTVSGNSGKTLSTVMEFGSRILGVPITREDGTEIPLRYRKPTKKNNCLFWVIGLNVDHIGQTLYHRLFSEGLGCKFRIIRDLETKIWRAYNPNTDRERESESRLSPPLIGDYLIEPGSWHMESLAGNVFKQVRLINGATLCAYPSTGDSPKQGDAVDGIWIDEDIEKGLFLKEWQDRLISVRGWFLWSVWPKMANEALIETLERAKDYAPGGRREVDNPPIKVFQLVGSDNPYSDKEGIAEGLARMSDDDDMAHRDRGDLDAFIGGRRMYDFGNLHIIKSESKSMPGNVLELVQDILSKERRLPASWTRYLVIDPSHTRTACLVGVVPPPEWQGIDTGDRLIIESELVVRKHTPAMFAEAMGPFTDLYFEAFIMDQRIGRQTTVGSDTTVFQVYENQFRQRGIQSRLTKSGFMRGCDDKALRRRTVRDFLEPTLGGIPRLLVNSKCIQTIKEFYNFRKKEVKDNTGMMTPLDDAANERLYDCMAAVEYLSQYISERFRDGTAYVEPERRRGQGSPAAHAAIRMQEKLHRESGGDYVHFGPGEAA